MCILYNSRSLFNHSFSILSIHPNSHDELITLGQKKRELLAYESNEPLTWCSGCGDIGVRMALIRALALEGLTKHDVALFYDIGCHGNESDKIGAYTLHGLHGRVIAAGAGAALANRRMKIIAQGGDGGVLSEGPGHLLHAVRSNYKMLFILHNNENYGLTTGQPSATTRQGFKMTGAPHGVPIPPLNACELVFALNPTFVARAFSGDVKHMTELIRAGLNHNGFAFLEIMQMCPTYNKATPAEWYWERMRYVNEQPDYDPSNLEAARRAALDLDEKVAVGLLYQNKAGVPFYDHLKSRQGLTTSPVDEVHHHDIAPFLEELG